MDNDVNDYMIGLVKLDIDETYEDAKTLLPEELEHKLYMWGRVAVLLQFELMPALKEAERFHGKLPSKLLPPNMKWHALFEEQAIIPANKRPRHGTIRKRATG